MCRDPTRYHVAGNPSINNDGNMGTQPATQFFHFVDCNWKRFDIPMSTRYEGGAKPTTTSCILQSTKTLYTNNANTSLPRMATCYFTMHLYKPPAQTLPLGSSIYIVQQQCYFNISNCIMHAKCISHIHPDPSIYACPSRARYNSRSQHSSSSYSLLKPACERAVQGKVRSKSCSNLIPTHDITRSLTKCQSVAASQSSRRWSAAWP